MITEKEKIKKLVMDEEYNKLYELVKEKKARLYTLISLSYTADNYVRLKVIKATGYVVSIIADSELDFVHTIITNLLWSLNDDSGSVGWSSPELLGEIITQKIELFKEYIPILISMLNIKETFFRPGVLWAMGKIATKEPSHIKPYAPYINMYLSDPVAETRGYAVWCLTQIGVPVPEEHQKHLLNDFSEILLLDAKGNISKKTICELTKETIPGSIR
jgi:hypothetical protein